MPQGGPNRVAGIVEPVIQAMLTHVVRRCRPVF